MTVKQLTTFIKESNKIEGIIRKPIEREIQELKRFTELNTITLRDLEQFVIINQPGAELRSKARLNVRIDNHFPPSGGVSIAYKLIDILDQIELTDESAFEIHNKYELLHPFTDGNGRSGRAIWLWQMIRVRKRFPGLGFLHNFYYQSLRYSRR